MKRTTTILAAIALLPLGLLAPAAAHANEADDNVIAYEVDWDVIDPATGSFTAAAVAVKAKPPMMTPNAVVSAGCGTWGVSNIGRTVGGRGVANCFSGRGNLSVSLPNTYYISAGDSDVFLYWSGLGGGTGMAAGYSGTFPSQNFVQIQRTAP